MDRNSNIGNGYTREEGYENRSLGNLLQEMGRQSQRLLRGEITLARAEFKAEAKKAAAGAGILTAAGGVLLLGALAFVAFLILALAQAVPAWASALIVSVAILAAGGGLLFVGLKRLKAVKGPEQTVHILKEDSLWASKTMRAVKSQRHENA